MSEGLNVTIELGVGLACLLAAVPALRARRPRWLGWLFALAGAAAVGHAIWALAT